MSTVILGIQKKKLLVPKLRFQEFDNEWNEILLEDFAKRGSGHTPNKSHPEYYNGDINWISLADSKKLDNGYIESTNTKITQLGLDNSSAVLHPPGTVLLSRDAGVGKSAIMKHAMAVSQHFLVWITKENFSCNWFLYNVLQILKPEFERIAIGNTIKTIGLPYFKKLKITVPSFPEQQKIASFLRAVDEKIQQLSRKKKLLEKYKKGVMQQLFSGKLRFKDENGADYPDWEEKKLGDVAKFRRGSFPQPYGLPKWYDDENGMPFIQVYDVDNNMLLKKTTKNKISELGSEQSVFVKKGTLVLTIQGSIGRIAKTQYDAYVDRTLLIFQSYKLPTDIDYFKYVVFLLFEIEKTKAPGGTIKTITKEVLTDFLVPVPCLKEQQKIADFLISIDTKIESVKQQIAQTQTFKKGLMQQMFI
jgi:type I restriction enzyme S subunit